METLENKKTFSMGQRKIPSGKGENEKTPSPPTILSSFRPTDLISSSGLTEQRKARLCSTKSAASLQDWAPVGPQFPKCPVDQPLPEPPSCSPGPVTRPRGPVSSACLSLPSLGRERLVPVPGPALLRLDHFSICHASRVCLSVWPVCPSSGQEPRLTPFHLFPRPLLVLLFD